jgi:hypothetical protein
MSSRVNVKSAQSAVHNERLVRLRSSHRKDHDALDSCVAGGPGLGITIADREACLGYGV